jgi:hypothetical protein
VEQHLVYTSHLIAGHAHIGPDLAALAESLTVVAGDDQQRVLKLAMPAQCLNDAPNLCIDSMDGSVIQRTERGNLSPRALATVELSHLIIHPGLQFAQSLAAPVVMVGPEVYGVYGSRKLRQAAHDPSVSACQPRN